MTKAEYNHALVVRYWQSLNARNWQEFRSTLSNDVIYEVPQTREWIRGLEPYVDFNATFPGDWTIEVARVVADEQQASGQIMFRDGKHEQTGIAFFEISDGKIQRIVDFWPEPYEPPKRMSRWVERY